MLAFVFVLVALLFWLWEWVVPLRVFFFPVYCKSVLGQEARDRNQMPFPSSHCRSWEKLHALGFFVLAENRGIFFFVVLFLAIIVL